VAKMNEDDSPEKEGETPLSVSKVKQNWREHEDFGMAYQMQNNEFSQHYDKNRSERRLMHGDICLTKEEQKAEDGYAAAYYEQLRRDQLKEDERLALELQHRLDEEERMARLAKEQEDRMLAERLQKLEMEEKQFSKSGAPVSTKRPDTTAASKRLDAGLAWNDVSQPYGITKSSSGNRLVLPPGVTPELVRALEEARDNGPIPLPPGLTLEQQRALQQASLEEDRRLAEEVQDYELARFVEGKEKPKEPNCVKPSELLALTKGKPSMPSGGLGKSDLITFDRENQYSVISKKTKKNFTQGSSQERQSGNGESSQRWEQFD